MRTVALEIFSFLCIIDANLLVFNSALFSAFISASISAFMTALYMYLDFSRTLKSLQHELQYHVEVAMFGIEMYSSCAL